MKIVVMSEFHNLETGRKDLGSTTFHSKAELNKFMSSCIDGMANTGIVTTIKIMHVEKG